MKKACFCQPWWLVTKRFMRICRLFIVSSEYIIPFCLSYTTKVVADGLHLHIPENKCFSFLFEPRGSPTRNRRLRGKTFGVCLRLKMWNITRVIKFIFSPTDWINYVYQNSKTRYWPDGLLFSKYPGKCAHKSFHLIICTISSCLSSLRQQSASRFDSGIWYSKNP